MLNQIDLRPTPEEVAEVEAYVRNNARYALGLRACVLCLYAYNYIFFG